MQKADAEEAAPILRRAMETLLVVIPLSGRSGADLRTACHGLIAGAAVLIQNDKAARPLINCFAAAQTAGATQKQLCIVRQSVLSERAVSVGAVLIKNSIIRMCLVTESRVITGMTFVSRDDTDALKLEMNAAFSEAEESAADEMDQMTYQALVSLHAAVTFHLIETAQPLPRIVKFVFASIMPTLQVAQRLYYDASRADELRAENKVVHPAFMLPSGRALSA